MTTKKFVCPYCGHKKFGYDKLLPHMLSSHRGQAIPRQPLRVGKDGKLKQGAR